MKFFWNSKTISLHMLLKKASFDKILFQISDPREHNYI